MDEEKDMKEVLVDDALAEGENCEAPPPTYYEIATPAAAPRRGKFFFLAARGTRGSTRWLYATIILCCYGFFKEFKPSEPFLTPYLVDYKNFTKSQVNSEVYPYWPYSYLVAAFFTFLLTDMLRYTPVILLESMAYLSTRILLVWGTSINAMRWMQIAYGVATATEIAYFSYIYTAVSVGYFKRVTSCVRAVRLVGQSTAGLLGQILISVGVFNTLQLNYISLVSVSIACVIAVFLPLADVFDGSCTTAVKEESTCATWSGYSIARWFTREVINRARDFLKFYSQPSLLKWSVWWALAMCGVLQVGNYVQSLWKEVGGEEAHGSSFKEYNGIVEALATLCGAGAATLVSFLKINWSVWGELTIGGLSLLDSSLLFFASTAGALWEVYLSHILYRATYSFLITVASTQLALRVDYNSYALIFGFNTFLALVLQTILTLIVADEHVLNLPIRTQFVVYGGYYFLLTLIFVGAGVYKLTVEGWCNSVRLCCKEPLPLQAEPHSPSPHRTIIQRTDEDSVSIQSTDKLI